MATLRSPGQLAAAGLVAEEQLPALEEVAARFAISITPTMQALIETGGEDDPIAAQFVPTIAELSTTEEERGDPIGDAAFSPRLGIVHRHADRVLLMPTHLCPVYCRFCFRRETVGPGTAGLSPAELDAALDYIEADRRIWEVIVTGGDPLAISARRIGLIMQRLSRIEHVAVVRFHSRVPVVRPDMVDAAMVAALRVDKAVYVVLHTNHARELTPPARAACARLIDAGIPMLSQTVLLSGVNADPTILAELLRALVAMRIKPYYLHHADLARGTGHFRTSIAEGQEIVRTLRREVSGLCQPLYVLDIPGGHGKVPVGPDYIQRREDCSIMVTDHRGRRHRYPKGDDAQPDDATEPSVRLARPDDLAAVETIIRAAFAVHTSRIGKPPAPMLRSYAGQIDAGEVSVLQVRGDTVGVLVTKPMPDHLYLDVVAVRPDRQGEGLGRRLVDHAEREAAALALPQVRLLTNALMTDNLTLYSRLGYVETHRAEEDGYHRIFMTKVLS